jgi:hypothetical protein
MAPRGMNSRDTRVRHQGLDGRFGSGAQVFTSPADAPKKDRRLTEPDTTGQQGEYTCECGAQVKLVRAPFSDPDLGILTKKTIVIPNHRHGGGRWSARRGDRRCPKSMTIPEEE